MIQTTRRTVLRTTAWTVPVVTLSSAAPSFATSDPTAIDFSAGATSVLTDGDFYGVEFSGASLMIGTGALTGPARLTMTVTFVPTSGDDELFSDLSAPVGWVHEPRSAAVRNTLVFTYQAVVTSGMTVPIMDGTYFGTDDVAQEGTFVLSFRAGDVSTQWMVATS